VSAILLTFLLTDASQILLSASTSNAESWRRGSESNEVFTDHQPQYPDFQSNVNADFTGLQAYFLLSAHYPALHGTYTLHTRLLKKSLKVSLKVFFAGLRPDSQLDAEGFADRIELRQHLQLARLAAA
jgi:hypothetical protein